MALVLLLLLTILAGVVDFGRAFYSYIAVKNASREGARYGSRFPYDGAGIRDTTIQEAAASGVNINSAAITINGLNGTGGSPIAVTVDHAVDTVMGGIIGLNTISMTTGTEMIIFGVNDES
jgi:Flp pilus assembly protein TadG